MIKKHIVLFDMDGTLTEPRMPFQKKLLGPLRKLSANAEIGILTGSDFDYLHQQMNLIIRFSELRFVTHLLPCNGTKHYYPPRLPDDVYKLIHEMNMETFLGKNCYKQLIMLLSSGQEEMCHYDFPLTGHFISCRGSMVNWSPVGRNATTEQRQQFIECDLSYSPSLREREINKLKYRINLRCAKNVTVKLGGETSFDIYPTGWDKTYALRHFPEHICWFVGDRCGPNGNDKEIYDLLSQENRAYCTKDPDNTVEIIQDIIRRIGNGE